MRRALRELAALAGLLVTGSAAASDLSWSGPEECRQSEQLLFQIERALGAPLAQVGNVQLQVHVERVAPDARALLRIADSTSAVAEVKKRLLSAPDCSTLVETLAVAIALAVEAAAPEQPLAHAASAQLDPLPAESSASPPAAPAVPRDEPPAAVLEPEAGSTEVVRVAALVLGDNGSLPTPALGFGVGAALAGSYWQLELLGTLWLEQHPLLAGAAGAGADVALSTGALLGCALPWGSAAGRQPLAASLCAGLELGRLAGEGTGVTSPQRQAALWLAPGLHTGLSWQVPQSLLRLTARIGLVLPLARPELVLDDLGAVHQPAQVVARGALGLELSFE